MKYEKNIVFSKISRPNANYFASFLDSHLVSYPSPSNLNYLWSFGSTAGICLVIQLLTGIFLAMHYIPEINHAFLSVEHIMRDVNYGWLLRYIHANGASFFFIVVYCHIFRGLYFGSYMYPRQGLWCSGIAIFFLMMATAFMGYVLPWGQMSFWGATVITNLFSAIPVIGGAIVKWLWGGFSVDNATLNRFFSLHYLMPFAIAGVTIIHLSLLHKTGSNNPLGIGKYVNNITFYPYFYVKDLLAFFYLLFFLFCFVIYYSGTLGHPDNYIPANPMVTPAHIVPEWYFLPFYAILRSIPDKLGGVVAMVGAIVLLLLLPFISSSNIRSGYFRFIYKYAFWFLTGDFLLLGVLGQKPVEDPYISLGLIATIFYMAFLTILIPVIEFYEGITPLQKNVTLNWFIKKGVEFKFFLKRVYHKLVKLYLSVLEYIRKIIIKSREYMLKHTTQVVVISIYCKQPIIFFLWLTSPDIWPMVKIIAQIILYHIAGMITQFILAFQNIAK